MAEDIKDFEDIGPDEAEWIILKMANETGKFASPVGEALPQKVQDAFERGIDNRWWDLVDVTPIQALAGQMLITRVFKLTEAGTERRGELARKFSN